MPEQLTISTKKPENPALDYQELRKQGIANIEKTTSAIWTDYNIHDPGITTLEYLCYAITDLSYRTSFSIPDLLATPTDTAQNIKEHFISAKNIFPNKAITDNDYRKLLIDIDHVKNAWIQKDTKTIYADLINKKLSHFQPASRKWEEIILYGYHQVLLEFDTNVAEVEKEAIKQEAKKVLMANRNLCEDFTVIAEVKREEFRLCSELEIATHANPVELMAQVFFNIQLHLGPIIKFYRLEELLGQNHTADEIFEGPLLSHGFIKDEELIKSVLKTEIHLSDIMQQILAVDGVLNIIDIFFNLTSQTVGLENKWIIDVSYGSQAIVNILDSNILLYKDGMPFRPKPFDIKQRFDQLMDAHIAANESAITEDIAYNIGTYRNIGQYHSIQHHFPKTYGISHWGLPEDAPAERKLQAKQFQAYLYFFDQHLANYLAQLANINQLFSVAQDVEQTYFTQLADDFKDANNLFTLVGEIKKNIQKAAENPETFDQRRNLFLDHLLSRFSESFFDYVNILKSVFPEMNRKEMIDTKIRFLKNYPGYSSRRFASFNYKDTAQWDTGNISGLEERLQSLLGFKNMRRRSLVNLFSVIKSEGEGEALQFVFELVDNRSENSIMLSAEKYPSAETAERGLADLFSFANDLSSFSIRTLENGMLALELKNSTGKVLAIGQFQYNSQQEAIAGRDELHSLISANQSDEGMFLVENILVLPEVKLPGSPLSPLEPSEGGNGFIPICADENCDECNSNDPYSFRLSFILPAYSKRFLDIDFRRYCERIIRMETPAHLYPKICWVNNEQLREFELAYKDWLEVKAGNLEDKNHLLLSKFVNIFIKLKSVYPPARLQDCTSLEERQLFLLNKNALGTLKS